MGPFELILFDLDGVLISTSACHARAFDELWARLGIAGPPYETLAGRRTSDVLAERLGALERTRELDECVRFKQERARALIASADVVFPDTPRSLERLAERGQRMALATAASGETARRALARLGPGANFAAVVTAEEIERGKPAPDVYLEAARRAGAAPARCLVVEDSAAGLEAALAAGAAAVTVRTGVASAHPRFLGALRDLDELVRRLGE